MSAKPLFAAGLVLAAALTVVSLSPGAVPSGKESAEPARIRMEEMTWKEIRRAIDSGYTTAVFAAGSMEQHGPQTPLAVDAMNGHEVAHRVARKLGQALQGPTITLGESSVHMAFAGTIALSAETVRRILREYCASLLRHGFQEIVIIPSHGGNYPLVEQVKQELAAEHPGVRFYAYTEFAPLMEALNQTARRLGVDPSQAGSHAGEHETSMTLFLRPELVNHGEMEKGFIGDMAARREMVRKKGYQAMSSNGATGDPFLATAGHGDAYLETWASYIVEHVLEERSRKAAGR